MPLSCPFDGAGTPGRDVHPDEEARAEGAHAGGRHRRERRGRLRRGQRPLRVVVSVAVAVAAADTVVAAAAAAAAVAAAAVSRGYCTRYHLRAFWHTHEYPAGRPLSV